MSKKLISKVNRGATIHTSDKYIENPQLPTNNNNQVSHGRFLPEYRKTVQITDPETYFQLQALKKLFPDTFGKSYSDIVTSILNSEIGHLNPQDKDKIDAFVKMQKNINNL